MNRESLAYLSNQFDRLQLRGDRQEFERTLGLPDGGPKPQALVCFI